MTTVAQRSFTAGEIGPALYSRCDMVKYMTGLQTCRNMQVMRHGGAQNRPGSTFVGIAKSPVVRLIPFIFNASQTYALEFGNFYMRVIKNGAYVYDLPQVIAGITQASQAVVTIPLHLLSNGDTVLIQGVVGMTELNGISCIISSVTANTFALSYLDGTPVNSTGFGAFVVGGSVKSPYQVTTPYASVNLADLKFKQSSDVIVLSHKLLLTNNLTRTSDTSWTFSVTLSNSGFPIFTTPLGLGISGGDPAAPSFWRITAVSGLNGEESLPTATFSSSHFPTPAAPMTFTWTAVTDAVSYNIYVFSNGVFGFYGSSPTNGYVASASVLGDVTNTPPEYVPFMDPQYTVGSYPGAVEFYQSRLILAGTPLKPLSVWASKSGLFGNFTLKSPTASNGALQFTLVGSQEIVHLLALNKLLIFTSGSEISIQGDNSGLLTPGVVNAKTQTYNGCSRLRPLPVNGIAIYVQARGSKVLDVGFEFQSDGYRGGELTIFSPHLVEGYSLDDWAYAQTPQSIVWAVRSDGTLLGLTYVREQQIVAWHRHDTQGFYKNVCVIPEGNEDAAYVAVQRNIGGALVTCIERMASRFITPTTIKDWVGTDCSLSYDGRHKTQSISMTVSGGTLWDYTETLTLTSSVATFVSTDIGNQIQLSNATQDFRFTITGFTSSTVVTGTVSETIPAGLVTFKWAKAVKVFGNLWHHEGKPVSIFADGLVVASPNNAAYPVYTVTNGKVVLPKAYAVANIGLPYISDMETLDIDTAQGESIANKAKLINEVTLHLENSRGVFAGIKAPTGTDPLQNLMEAKVRDAEGYNDPVNLMTGKVKINILSNWNSNGHVFIRQVDPLPLSVLSIIPSGLLPFKAGG